MHSLITSYLLQNKECILPGIGVLQIIHTPAGSDHANSRLLPPFEEIIFKKESHTKSEKLVKYIADKKHIQQAEAENLLTNFCDEWNEKINAGGRLEFETVGSIQKDADNVTGFERESCYNFLQPIAVNKVYKSEASHEQLKKDTETVTARHMASQENTFEEDVVIERSYWGFWALILFAIGSVMLFYYFKDHKLSGSSAGNQHIYTIDSATATYTVPK